MAPRPEPPGLPPDGPALARVVAHELNNIAVPLQGFVDLAGNGSIPGELLKQCLDEVRISTARLLELSRDISAFAGDAHRLRRVPLHECMPDEIQPVVGCDANLPVLADPTCILQSLTLLARLASPPADWAATTAAGRKRACDACGTALPAEHVLIALRAARLPPAAMLADPLAPAHRLRTVQRLRLAAAAHAAHLGGAHLVGAITADSLALVLPIA